MDYAELCETINEKVDRTILLRRQLRELEGDVFILRLEQAEQRLKSQLPEEVAELLPQNNSQWWTVVNRLCQESQLLLHRIVHASYKEKVDLEFWLAVIAELIWNEEKMFSDADSRYKARVELARKSLGLKP